MTFPHLNPVLDAVAQASRLCRLIRAELQDEHVEQKTDLSPVTVADFAAQAVVCRALRQAGLQQPIVAEEDAKRWDKLGADALLQEITRFVADVIPGVGPAEVMEWISLGHGEPTDEFWTLDPIDGTKGFLRDDQYAVVLALIHRGEVQFGIMGCPALPVEPGSSEQGMLFWAERGQGARRRALAGGPVLPLQIDAGRPRLIESVEVDHGNPELQEKVAGAVGLTEPPLRMDSQAKYAALARGEGSIYLRLRLGYREKIWDHAAGVLLVQEAGGEVTDLYGNPLDFSQGRRLEKNQGVVAAAPGCLQPALRTLREVLNLPGSV